MPPTRAGAGACGCAVIKADANNTGRTATIERLEMAMAGALYYPQSRLTGAIKSQAEQTTYLLFIRRLDELHTLEENQAALRSLLELCFLKLDGFTDEKLTELAG